MFSNAGANCDTKVKSNNAKKVSIRCWEGPNDIHLKWMMTKKMHM